MRATLTDVLDLTTSLRRDVTPPEDSVFARLLDVKKHPTILIYGPSKAGKSMLAAWEATALASVMQRKTVWYIVAEVNYEEEDLKRIIGACAKRNVECMITLIETHQVMGDIVALLERKYAEIVPFAQRVTRTRRRKIETDFPSVVVVDSVSGLAELLISKLSFSLIESGAGSLSPYFNPLNVKLFTPLRKILSRTGGFLLVTAQETFTRERQYAPGLNRKPRYAGGVQYIEDAELWLGTWEEAPSQYRCGTPWETHPLVVAKSRRDPSAVGRFCGIVFEDSVVEAEGVVEEGGASDVGRYTVIYRPGGGGKVKAPVLVPKVVCQGARVR